MSLSGLLALGSSAMMAQEAGVSVTGRNTANAGTAGYSRESVDLQSQLAAPLVGGVQAGDVGRADDPRLAKAERGAAGANGQASSLSAALADLSTALTPSDNDVPRSIAQLFARLNEVAASPTDTLLRSALVGDAGAVANQFHDAAAAIASARDTSDARIGAYAQQATDLAAQIASANKALGTRNDPVLADKRDYAAKQLAELVGGEARIDSDGRMRFVAGSGVVLVDGDRAASLRAVPDTTMSNHVRLEAVDGSHVTDMTQTLDGGKIAGELSFRDGGAQTAANALDQLAYDLATQMNTVHRANAALDGTTGRDFFTAPTGVAGAAAALTVSSAIVADPALVAAAAPGTGPGNATGVNALLALRDQPLAAGGTKSFLYEGIALIGNVGSAAASAEAARSVAAAKVSVLDAARDSISGVNQEEELARLSAFQHGHDAAVKFVSTVNELLSDMIDKL